MSGTISGLVSPSSALSAYGRVAGPSSSAGPSFGDFVSNVVTSAVHQSASTEQAANAGLLGNGDLTHVVASVAQAQVALQTTVAIRDRLITAYQSIMNMPI
ncbi:MAG TPA: flagellar hook-basal body complex protein FliE [Acidiphilium sp.]|jgi:flagellar hook-basal body complex protein FliE|uniref:flagellar hook-basal body complex protein FliE n=1 Tax=unclassified Acidiphilium TaxID=2617493 RepID=UPI000BCB3DE4|nr:MULTISPECIES: flagellar hook-basal body complex protein FliE [unclassified Acidiphilium]OYV57106.1 MAG: flagellar hook-basal body protein FliE [Acidiphilium sp. 20-67-58]OYV85541.1 MAG: flagellar hook-basal body protein FliE [Acidiphilium sp. 21-68-69]HQT60718.1 flagellar hook-basal body complex protein FliE [Acidiphilium sp.]HQU10198.1 flagellar hook-basal body complex protein FliE [Acidiphilium sp.]